MSEWISVKDELPDEETPVLAFAPNRYDAPVVAARFWEYASYEDAYNSFLYWDAYHNDGQDIDSEVTHWIPLPEPPLESKDE